MLHREIDICGRRWNIRADLKAVDRPSDVGVVLVHGGIVNRNSLSRESFSMAEYLSRKLNAVVLTPDYLGETTYDRDPAEYGDAVSISNTCVDYLTDEMGVETVLGFGHSMGCSILADVANMNPKIAGISTYGAPIFFERYFRFANLLRVVLKNTDKIIETISMRRWMWVFDRETLAYYYDVMQRNPQYGATHYTYEYPSSFLMGFFNALINCRRELERWTKPSLMLYGKKDSLVSVSKLLYPNGWSNKNIHVRHIEDCCHVTPCREEPHELQKLEQIIPFFKQIINDSRERIQPAVDFPVSTHTGPDPIHSISVKHP